MLIAAPRISASSLVLVLTAVLDFSGSAAELHWSKLPPIPDEQGFAAPFAGVSGGALVVAGGANFPGDKWADTTAKKWHDSVFVLTRPDGRWQLAGKLPRPLAYGVAVTAKDGVICAGGSDETRHFPEVFQLAWKDGRLVTTPLPRLPKPTANACGALLGSTIYIAGGIESPTAPVARKTFWALDLAEPEPRWRELQPWPGPERMLAVAGVHDGSFFLFSGVRLIPGSDGTPVREYLRDAYRYTPGKGWKRIANLPRPAAAAPSPGIPVGSAGVIILTGDDGVNAGFQPLEKHPGFPRDVLAYDAEGDRWTREEGAPFSRATTPVVQWGGQFVLPNGEVRPRVRTPEVWTVRVPVAR